MPKPEQEQKRREEARREVLCYLADRSALAFPVEAIQRKLRIDGGDFTLEEITAALEFLSSFTPDPLVKIHRDPFGATRNYQVSTAGVLFHERSK